MSKGNKLLSVRQALFRRAQKCIFAGINTFGVE